MCVYMPFVDKNSAYTIEEGFRFPVEFQETSSSARDFVRNLQQKS